MHRGLMRLLGQVARLVGLPVLFVVALVLHLPTRLGRAAATDLVRAAVADLAPGHFTLRRITRFDSGSVTVEGVNWHDLDGRALLEDAVITATPSPALLLAAVGRGSWPAITVDAQAIRLFAPGLTGSPPSGPVAPP